MFAGVCKKEEDFCISGRWIVVWIRVDGIWKPWVPGQRGFGQSSEAESVGESETTPCLSSKHRFVSHHSGHSRWSHIRIWG